MHHIIGFTLRCMCLPVLGFAPLWAAGGAVESSCVFLMVLSLTRSVMDMMLHTNQQNVIIHNKIVVYTVDRSEELIST